MANRILAGIVAGAAGTVAINIATYVDMLVRGRPASTLPAKVARKIADEIGLPLDFAPQEPGEDGTEIAARAKAAGAFVSLPHPQWTGVTPKDARKIEDFDAIEIHNEGHTNDSDRGNGWFLADLMATAGYRFSCTAADDDCPPTGWKVFRCRPPSPSANPAAIARQMGT